MFPSPVFVKFYLRNQPLIRSENVIFEISLNSVFHEEKVLEMMIRIMEFDIR